MRVYYAFYFKRLGNFHWLFIFAQVTCSVLNLTSDIITNLYGGQLRVRSCGIYLHNGRILMVEHMLYDPKKTFFSPPGGGVQFGESAEEALQREFFEEAGLIVTTGRLLFINEFIKPPLHAIEFFFEVHSAEGELKTGSDPELSPANQIIKNVRFMRWDELANLPEEAVHSLFRQVSSLEDILNLQGLISI